MTVTLSTMFAAANTVDTITIQRYAAEAAIDASYDAEWDRLFEANSDVLDTLIAEAEAEISAGTTLPLKLSDF